MQGGWGAMGAGAWGGNNKAPLVDDDEEAPKATHTVPSAPIAPAPNPAAAAFTSSSAMGGAYPGSFGVGMPASSSAPAGSGSMSEAELRRKEAELKKKEAELRKLESELRAAGQLKRKNFPICFPMWYHDISGDIPEKSRRYVRSAYFCWWGLVFCLSYQIFCASCMLGFDAADKVPSWFLSIIYWITGVPLGMYLWYRRLYNAARDDSTLGMWGFFLFFFINTAFCIWCAIAIPFSAERWSFCGFATAIAAFNNVNDFTGIIYIIGACLWVLESLLCLWTLREAWAFWRAGGIKSAKDEATRDAAVKTFAQGMAGSMNRV